MAIVAKVGKGGGGAGAVGAAVAIDEVANITRAQVDGSTLKASSDIGLSAQSHAVIDALTLAAAGSVATDKGPSIAIAGAGAAAVNTITNTIEAVVSGGSSVDSASGELALEALDPSQIAANAAGGSVAISAGKGGSAAVAVGVSVARNGIDNGRADNGRAGSGLESSGHGPDTDVSRAETQTCTLVSQVAHSQGPRRPRAGGIRFENHTNPRAWGWASSDRQTWLHREGLGGGLTWLQGDGYRPRLRDLLEQHADQPQFLDLPEQQLLNFGIFTQSSHRTAILRGLK